MHKPINLCFRFKKDFRKLLEDNPQVTPGKKLEDVYLFFVGKDCYNELKQYEREQVFEEHQNGIKMEARRDFQELLWEKMEIFIRMCQHMSNMITPEDIHTIMTYLKDDHR